MKIKSLGWVLIILLLLINIWAILTEIFWLENTSSMLFFLVVILLAVNQYKKFNRFLYMFLGFTVLSYLMRFYSGDWYSNEIALLFLTVAYLSLNLEAIKHIAIKNASNYMLLYFILVVGINGCLLGYHLLEIKQYMSSNIVFSVYLIYYINLLITGIIAFIYYLNSYSKKSMYYISLVLGIIFADVLRDIGVFFPKDPSVEIAESIIRSGSAVFAILFFVTKEKQLRLLNMI